MNKELSGVWKKQEIITFNLPELDSLKGYDLFINLRINLSVYWKMIILLVILKK